MNKDIFYIKDLQQIRAFCLYSDKEDVYKYIYSLQQENQQLHNKIDKAIEYINGAWEMGCYTKTVALYSEELEELLEILKDGDVDE